ncbi:hypothetical protein TNIN_243361 [Trichonephila inaurata madagascariensis]|uniref:DNA repair protein SWI5 homolog n=1 Tax=Trichonephila inaurata madagascariensis TaxID=2747483 RepID=A0A8X7C8I4_9ARAC|nr:hypothetical protein TNIN_243361 [Trichonephila inaurata madagascariensis]
MMEASSTPKMSQVRRSRLVRPSPSSSFKSPLLKAADKKVAFQFENTSTEDMKKSVVELWQKNEDLKKEIKDLKEKGFKEDDLKWYIDKLHEYNEIKDIAQMIMGKIAVLEQTTVRKVHEEFGMKDDD